MWKLLERSPSDHPPKRYVFHYSWLVIYKKIETHLVLLEGCFKQSTHTWKPEGVKRGRYFNGTRWAPTSCAWNYNLTPFNRRVNITIYPFILFSGRLWGAVYKSIWITIVGSPPLLRKLKTAPPGADVRPGVCPITSAVKISPRFFVSGVTWR